MIRDIFYLFALIFFFVVDSWGACLERSSSYGDFSSGTMPKCNLIQVSGSYYCDYGDRLNFVSCPGLTTGYEFSVSSSCGVVQGYQGAGFERCECRSIVCSTQFEADSVACVNGGQSWNNGVCSPACDSTKYTCETTTTTTQTTIANEDVTCFNGECYGGVYCEYVTENTTTCTNECGGITTETARYPMRYDGACNEETAPDEEQCGQLKCVTNSSGVGTFYHLFRNCKNRNLINGEAQTIPVFEGGGVGTCKNAGYSESSMTDSQPVDSTSISKDCFLYGLNCPAVDSTDYSSEQNRNSENGCSCNPYDGLSHISQIVCPDGSMSVFYGSCNEWDISSSSGDNPPESSSSGSENPPTSSGGSGEALGNWTTYSQGETIKDLLAQIVSNTGKQNQQSINIQTGLSDYQYFGNDSEIEWNRHDSILVINSDSSGFGALKDSLNKALWSRLDSNNKILDTLNVESWSGCPTVNILGGSNSSPNTQSGIYLRGFSINFCDIGSFNFVRIVSVIVVAFASVVGFFIGFAIFRNVSQ